MNSLTLNFIQTYLRDLIYKGLSGSLYFPIDARFMLRSLISYVKAETVKLVEAWSRMVVARSLGEGSMAEGLLLMIWDFFGGDKNILKLDGAKKCSVRNRDKTIKERDTVL